MNVAADLDDALTRLRAAASASGARSASGCVGNAADVLPDARCARDFARRRRHRPDLRARPAERVHPDGPDSIEQADALRRSDPDEYLRRVGAAMLLHVARDRRASSTRGAEVFDYGNACVAGRRHGGFERAFAYPGFVPAYIRPLFCEGKGPFRWVALSGDPADIAATDRAMLDVFPDDEHARAVDPARRRAGRTSRGCRRGSAGSATASGDGSGLRFNEMVASGEL